MKNMDKAIIDIGKIIGVCDKYDDDCATPMPFSTVKEAYTALVFKKMLLERVSKLEPTADRAKARVDAFQKKMDDAITHPNDREMLQCATDVLQFILDEYFSV